MNIRYFFISAFGFYSLLLFHLSIVLVCLKAEIATGQNIDNVIKTAHSHNKKETHNTRITHN